MTKRSVTDSPEPAGTLPWPDPYRQRGGGGLRESVYLHVYIDEREVMSDSLGPGATGPITLAGEIE